MILQRGGWGGGGQTHTQKHPTHQNLTNKQNLNNTPHTTLRNPDQRAHKLRSRPCQSTPPETKNPGIMTKQLPHRNFIQERTVYNLLQKNDQN